MYVGKLFQVTLVQKMGTASASSSALLTSDPTLVNVMLVLNAMLDNVTLSSG